MVEVVIAVLLTSVMVTSVFSVALTTKGGGGKTDRKILAVQGTRRIASQLRNYVTGDETTTTIDGPGLGTNKWSLDGGDLDDESCTDCWALAPGTHVVRGALPAWFEGAPYNARILYHVDASRTVDGRAIPAVTFTAHWCEPGEASPANSGGRGCP